METTISTVTILDSVTALILAVLLVVLLRTERAQTVNRKTGWKLTVIGVCLLLMGKLVALAIDFQVVENEEDIGSLSIAVILEEIVGFIGGLLAVAAGIFFWLREEANIRDNFSKELEEKIYWLKEAQRIGKVGHWVWDESQDIDIANSELTKQLWGLRGDSNKLTYEAFLKSVHPDDRKRVDEYMNNRPPEETHYECSYRVVLPNGEIRHLKESSEPVYNAEGELIRTIGLVQDITQNKLNEENLRAAQRQAEYANQSKSRFLASMSHELRTPLNAIIGFSDIIAKQQFGSDVKRYQDYGKIIHTSGELLLSLVNDILDLSAIEAGGRAIDPQPLAVSDVVNQAVKIVSSKAKLNRVKIVITISDDVPVLVADERSMVQVLINLLYNAIKFTPEGKSVHVSVEARDGRHRFVVRDEGVGIPPDRLAVVAEPFVSSETDIHLTKEGIGLGLAIVKSLVEMHHGDLDLQSEVDVGTTVTVSVPSVQPDPEDVSESDGANS